jgi:hypothetical protein
VKTSNPTILWLATPHLSTNQEYSSKCILLYP